MKTVKERKNSSDQRHSSVNNKKKQWRGLTLAKGLGTLAATQGLPFGTIQAFWLMAWPL